MVDADPRSCHRSEAIVTRPPELIVWPYPSTKKQRPPRKRNGRLHESGLRYRRQYRL